MGEKLRNKKRKNYVLPKINSKNTVFVSQLPAKPKKRKIEWSETEEYRVAQIEIRARKKRLDLIHQIKKFSQPGTSPPKNVEEGLPPLSTSGGVPSLNCGLFGQGIGNMAGRSGRTRSGSNESQNS